MLDQHQNTDYRLIHRTTPGTTGGQSVVVDRNGSPVQGARLQLFSRIDGRYHQDWRYQDATSGRDGGA